MYLRTNEGLGERRREGPTRMVGRQTCYNDEVTDAPASWRFSRACHNACAVAREAKSDGSG